MRVRLALSSLLVLGLAGCTPGSIGIAEGGETAGDEVGESSGEGSGDGTTGSTESGSSEDEGETIPVVCDPWSSSCGADQKCAYFPDEGTNYCVPVTGSAPLGSSCIYSGELDGYDDCDAATVCANLIDTGSVTVGRCTARCQGSADDPICEPGLACHDASAQVLCLEGCDILLQDCPVLGEACYWIDESIGSLCLPAGDAPMLEACEHNQDCAPGLFCILAASLPGCEADSCCTPHCSLSEPDCSAIPGTECVEFYDDYWGYQEAGVCALPG
ncbi:hypothetical protein [Plesiocystis pacifica]|uniref:hypothetical protein n=1 Tax=Plesiocystis pacifica TaxID=191768 RepID=UPI0012F87C58|nr:hypothetical protein [Plesiocystis pacifica]